MSPKIAFYIGAALFGYAVLAAAASLNFSAEESAVWRSFFWLPYIVCISALIWPTKRMREWRKQLGVEYGATLAVIGAALVATSSGIENGWDIVLIVVWWTLVAIYVTGAVFATRSAIHEHDGAEHLSLDSTFVR